MSERSTADGKTTYLEAGRGRPVVLVHGFPLSKAMWQPQVDALASVARVLVPDLPGFGGSRGFDGPPTVEAMADRVAEFLTAVGVREPAVVGGLSMGGYVTLAFARRHSGRLAGLILADTKAEADDETGKANRDKMIVLARESGPGAVVDQMMPKLVGAGTMAREPQVAERLRAIALEQSGAALADALLAMRNRPDSGPGLAAIGVPTLVVVGAEDTLTPPEKAEYLARAIPGAKLVVIPGAGHVANLEAPQAFNAAVVDFLAKCVR
jgi:pimeloyl-ACP methyl ester carboxylesterase